MRTNKHLEACMSQSEVTGLHNLLRDCFNQLEHGTGYTSQAQANMLSQWIVALDGAEQSLNKTRQELESSMYKPRWQRAGEERWG